MDICIIRIRNTDCTASLHEFFSCFFIYFCRFWTIQMINFSKPFNEWRTHKRLLLLRIWMEMQKIFFAIIQFHLEHFSFKFKLFSFRIICTPHCVCILHVSHLASFFPYLNSLHRRNTFFFNDKRCREAPWSVYSLRLRSYVHYKYAKSNLLFIKLTHFKPSFNIHHTYNR